MNDWKEISLGEVCITISDTIKKKEFENVVLINTSDVLQGKVLNHTLEPNKNLKGQFKKKFKQNDILYSEIRPKNGRFAFIDFNSTGYVASTKLMVIRCNENLVVPSFLYGVLKSPTVIDKLQSLAETRSGTFPQITFSELSNIEIKLPSISEQKQIAKILSSIDDKIELNNKINDNLEQQAQAIFKSWFVDFEPFGGVMPADWSTSNLLGIADYINGLAMQKYRPQENEDSFPVLKIKELRQGSCDSSSDRCSKDIKSDYIVHDGDVIFSWSGSLMLDFWCGNTCGLNQHLFKVTSSIYDKWFYYLWTNFHLQKFIAIAEAKATTMGHIKRGELETSEVVIPDSTNYEQLTNTIQPILDLVVKRRIENRKLTLLRNTLLPQLMSGEIDVSQVES